MRILYPVFLFLGLLALVPSIASPLGNNPPMVRSIEIEFIGHQNASDEAVYAHIKILPGQEYNQSIVNQSIRSLYKTGLFDSIRVRSDSIEDDQIILTFVLDPKPRITEIIIEGNHRIATRKLYDKIKTPVDQPLDETSLNEDIQKLLEYYHKRGFSDIIIDYVVDADPVTGKGLVTFRIDEGVKRRISKITFVGDDCFKKSELIGVMKTKEWGILSFITGKGRYQKEILQDDLLLLRNFYRDHGYLDVDIPESSITLEYPGHSSIEIIIYIDTGRQYEIGHVSISGNTLYTVDDLETLLTVHEGDVFSPARIDQSEELLRDAYGQVGYLDTVAIAERIPNIDTGAIDLNFVIYESEKFFVESIKIQGNTKTKSNVILRELALAPGDIFDLVRMKNSQKRLENTRFFEEVSFIPEDAGIPGRRNLLIALKEGRTGNLQFGVSVSSLESVVGSVEFGQGNFDFKNFRNGFQGGGQKFRLSVRAGKLSRQLTISFEEPWVCERELAFGINAFHTGNKYNSNLYNELRTGFEVYLRKRLFGLVDGQLSYLLEEVKIENVVDNAIDEIKAEKGKRTVSKVGFALGYDTRDNLIYPTDGLMLGSNLEVAGGLLRGQTKYVRLELRAARWFPLFEYCSIFEPMQQVFLIGGRTGTLMSYGNQRIPYFDRYFLGGPNTLRGYDFRDVGPKDKTGKTTAAIGGDTMARFTAEYSFKLMDPLRFALFYDWGFINEKDLNWSPHNYNDNWGVGLRIFILGAPLRIDFGFPIHGDGKNDKKKHQFHFSFGTSF